METQPTLSDSALTFQIFSDTLDAGADEFTTWLRSTTRLVKLEIIDDLDRNDFRTVTAAIGDNRSITLLVLGAFPPGKEAAFAGALGSNTSIRELEFYGSDSQACRNFCRGLAPKSSITKLTCMMDGDDDDNDPSLFFFENLVDILMNLNNLTYLNVRLETPVWEVWEAPMESTLFPRMS